MSNAAWSLSTSKPKPSIISAYIFESSANKFNTYTMCCQYLDKFINEYNKHDWSYAAALDDSADQVNLVR